MLSLFLLTNIIPLRGPGGHDSLNTDHGFRTKIMNNGILFYKIEKQKTKI